MRVTENVTYICEFNSVTNRVIDDFIKNKKDENRGEVVYY